MRKQKTLPQGLVDAATIPGIPGARLWGDEEPADIKAYLELPLEELRRRFPGICGVEHNYLAISGGGGNGAFGAGFLKGWTEKGTRPQFNMVTGISTGALTAPFALLGPSHDDRLEEIFTSYSTSQLVKRRPPYSLVTSNSLLTAHGLKGAISRYFDRDMLYAVAKAWLEKSQSLTIGTTDLHTLRPVLWRIHRIASSGQPGALELIRNVLLASSSIPIAFPPVTIAVEAEGQQYEETHIDGGAAAQVFLYPAELDWKKLVDKLEATGRPNVFLIRNSRMRPDWDAVRPRLLPIALRTVTSLIRTQGIGDIYRVFLSAQRDGLDFHLIHIPDDFEPRPKEQFDPVYMRELFDLGRSLGRSDDPWKKQPPGF